MAGSVSTLEEERSRQGRERSRHAQGGSCSIAGDQRHTHEKSLSHTGTPARKRKHARVHMSIHARTHDPVFIFAVDKI